MDTLDGYRQWLESLGSKPEPEAAEALRKALLKGTSTGGLTFMRADIHNYFEHVHHYYGCPEDNPCDHYHLDEPLPWEANLLVPMDVVLEDSTPLALDNYLEWWDVGSAVYHFGDLIRDRWLKKSVLQKRAILLQAMPTLPLKHRPDIDQCVLKCCPHQRSSARAQYAFPHMNIEDLTKPNSLLILLDARAKNAPYKFALSDHELAPLIKLRPDLLESTKYTMGVINDEYGMIKEWDTEEAAAHAIFRGDAVHPVHCLHILALQAGMYSFLKVCIQKIIPDKIDVIIKGPLEIDTICDGPVLVPAQSPNEASYSLLEAIVRESHYRVPTLSDIDRLQALVFACKYEAEDHIWMLHEDPGYFAEIVTENKEHRPELLPGVCCGRIHKTGDPDALWARTLRDSVANGYIDLFVWNQIYEHISDVARLAKLHTQHFGRGIMFGMSAELPNALSESLIQTWSFLELIELDFIQQLKFGWPASLEVRAFFVQDCGPNDDKIVLGVKFKGGRNRKRDKELEHIFQLFRYLWEPPVRQSLKVHTLVDAIEYLLKNNARARSLTSPWVVSVLSKLSVVSECLRQLNFFQPWAKKVANSVKKRQTELLIKHSTKFAQWRPILQTDFRGTALVDLGKPGAQFRYPVKKRRTQANVEMLRGAEAALDAFWEAADARFLECTGTTPHELVRHIMKERSLQRTPAWVEPAKDPQLVSLKPVAEYIYIPLSNALHDPTQQITGAFDKLSVFVLAKPKTHGLPCPDITQDTNQTTIEESDQQPTFHVDKRAHKVFRNLFHSPLSRDHPGDIPWQDFLHAMISTGFLAQKLQGSAWQFTPKDLHIAHPIQFHEPHPTHKLPFTWARRFGRRLARSYGWRGDMFKLAE